MSEAALKRAGIRHNDVLGSLIAPLCGLVDHFVRGAAQEHLPHYRWRNLSRVRQCCLFVKGVRHQVLRTREPFSQRMAGAVASEHLVRRGQRRRLQNWGVQCLVDGAATGAGDDQELDSREDGHRVAPRVGRRGPDNFQTFGVVFGPVGERGKPGICVTPGGPQHPWTMSSDPNLRPFPPIGRKVEHRVAQWKERRIPFDELAIRIPERPDRGQGLFKPCDRFRPVHSVGFVAFSFAGSDAQDRASAGQQVQRRGGLRRHGRVAAPRVGHAHTKAQPAQTVAGWDGSVSCVDLVSFNDEQMVINTASVGAYPRLVQTRERLEHKIGKPLAAAYAMLHNLRREDPVHIRYDNKTMQTSMFFLGNSTYLPSGFAPAQRNRIDDGLIDVRMLETGHRLSKLRVMTALMLGRLQRSRLYHEFHGPEFSFNSVDGPTAVALDGEVAGQYERATFRVCYRVLPVFRPLPRR